MRARAFDSKYLSGEWSQNPDKPLAREIERFASGGRIVILGCGSCGLAAEISPSCYSEIVGVDVSPEGIRLAHSQNVPKARFIVADVATWRPTCYTSVTVFPESIYYLSGRERRDLLFRIYHMQRPADVIMATISNPKRYGRLIESIRRDFRVQKEACLGGERQLLVFR